MIRHKSTFLIALACLALSCGKPRPSGVSSALVMRSDSEGSTPMSKDSSLGAALTGRGYSCIALSQDQKTFQVMVACRVNGQALNLLVDTGANRTSISSVTAKNLKVPLIGADTTAAFGKEMLKVSIGRIEAFAIGELEMAQQNVLVIDDSVIRAMKKKEEGHRGWNSGHRLALPSSMCP